MTKSLIMRKQMRNGWALVPVYSDDEKELERLKRHNYYKVTIKLSRNPQFHRLAFAFLNDVFKFQNGYKDREQMRKQLSIDAGHYDHYFIEGDKICVTPKSWDFDSMDELTFQPLIAKIVEAAITRFDIPRDADFLPDIFVENFQ